VNQISGSTPFKIKYKYTDLYVAPKSTSSVMGTLYKGAVVLVVEDSDPYYYKVKLDNGLVGYVYKDSGVISAGATPSKFPVTAEEKPAPSPEPSVNGRAKVSSPAVEKAAPAPRPAPAYTPKASASNGVTRSTESAAPTAARVVGAGPGVTVTSAEIAVYDKPGIIGKQVAKLRRGDRAALISDDGYFYQVRLATGIIGYIPRYAAEKK
jgi:hypothetical protein